MKKGEQGRDRESEYIKETPVNFPSYTVFCVITHFELLHVCEYMCVQVCVVALGWHGDYFLNSSALYLLLNSELTENG